MKKIIPLVAAVALLGCEQETVPEASAITCSPVAFQQTISELSRESSRKAFTEACRSFEKAQRMREWEFKPSSPDRY
ncbi:entry exclusion lipoprotein TrbK [Halomonas sp. DP1Y21-3]|uniref:entry exclusion lipoprotein TrbK n=1 Tax=Halomonas sp. DP1Y21-3 TaxID=2859080 RepID=UPI001C980546|nr:entry exclusion lipoprotein TrbK [Halomonas sp. DP1Y21-3]MBY6109976.1 entry exclusion lipoprotein TrbK [Halomonas sp. DP1Y21-3]